MNQETRSSQTGMLRHIPNGITSLRIVIAALFPFAPESSHLLLILAGLATEFLDGFIAHLGPGILLLLFFRHCFNKIFGLKYIIIFNK